MYVIISVNGEIAQGIQVDALPGALAYPVLIEASRDVMITFKSQLVHYKIIDIGIITIAPVFASDSCGQ